MQSYEFIRRVCAAKRPKYLTRLRGKVKKRDTRLGFELYPLLKRDKEPADGFSPAVSHSNERTDGRARTRDRVIRDCTLVCTTVLAHVFADEVRVKWSRLRIITHKLSR